MITVLGKRHRKSSFWMIILISLLFGTGRNATSISSSETTSLIINEFVAANRSGLMDEDGDYSDWIEIYNRSSQPVNLSGWALTDTPEQPKKWLFPPVTLMGHDYLIVFASGKDRKLVEAATELHTNFKLDDQGEFLALYSTLEDKLMDALSPHFPGQLRDVAYGRYGTAQMYGYLANPTPGHFNDETTAWAGRLDEVSFSAQRGFYEVPFTLTLETITPEAMIRYTTDGSEPSETHGIVYTAPIKVETSTAIRATAFKPGYLPAPVTTHTYIFLAEVLTQSPHPKGFPATWGTFEDGSPVIADYEMDPEVVNDPRYRDLFPEAMRVIPTLSIVTDMKNLEDLYANPQQRGRAWERPASVELIYPNQKQTGFQINAGLRIQGNSGRFPIVPKHPLRLFFRSQYGASKLRFPLFPDSPVEEFETLVLRAGTHDSYAGPPISDDFKPSVTYTRDEWLRASQRAISGIGSHGIFVHLYLNGLYWGLYNVVERPDAAFTSAYLGGQEEEWSAINHRGVLNGPPDRFNELFNLIQAGGLADPERYRQVKEYLDTTNFIDYVILNAYSGNRDWGLNNWFVGFHNPAGQVKYFIWDGEGVWVTGGSIPPDVDYGPVSQLRILFNALIQNPDFKIELADRIHKHMFNDGGLTDLSAQTRWEQINQPVSLAILAETARWGDIRREKALTQEDWLRAYEDVLTQMRGNTERWIELARRAGYYPNLEAVTFNQHGGTVAPNFTLTMSGPSTIYFTTDGTDPRLPVSGEIAPTARPYAGPLILTQTAQIKARAIADSDWSALTEATFQVYQAASQLQLTELMYNPPGSDETEFIELKNIGTTDLLLAGAYFETGVQYLFPADIKPLSPGEVIVLVRDTQAFAETYPGVTISGVYEGQLSNEGEQIELKDRTGQILISLTYDDESGWPLSADGRGDSLVLREIGGNPNDARNWQASTHLAGSPGMDEPDPQKW